MLSDSSPAAVPVTLTGQVITQAIAFFCFLVLPTVITLMAPRTRLELQHSPTGPTGTVTRYVFLFLPWKTEHRANVSGIRADITPEYRYRGTSVERRKGQKDVRLATGQLILSGDGSELVVQAAPDLAETVAQQGAAFIADPSAGPKTFSLYASWGLSYVLGGIATAFSAFYIFGVSMTVLMSVYRLLRPSGH